MSVNPCDELSLELDSTLVQNFMCIGFLMMIEAFLSSPYIPYTNPYTIFPCLPLWALCCKSFPQDYFLRQFVFHDTSSFCFYSLGLVLPIFKKKEKKKRKVSWNCFKNKKNQEKQEQEKKTAVKRESPVLMTQSKKELICLGKIPVQEDRSYLCSWFKLSIKDLGNFLLATLSNMIFFHVSFFHFSLSYFAPNKSPLEWRTNTLISRDCRVISSLW